MTLTKIKKKALADQLAKLTESEVESILLQAGVGRETLKRKQADVEVSQQVKKIPQRSIDSIAKRIKDCDRKVDFKFLVQPTIEIKGSAFLDANSLDVLVETHVGSINLNKDLSKHLDKQMREWIKRELDYMLSEMTYEFTYKVHEKNILPDAQKLIKQAEKTVIALEKLADKYDVDPTDIWNYLVKEGQI